MSEMETMLKLFKENRYEELEEKIELKIKDDNVSEKEKIKSYYMLAYINSDYNYQNRNIHKAKRYIKYCINSQYVEEMYYKTYKRLEDDRIVLESSLKKGLKRFPNSILLNTILFDLVDIDEKKEMFEKIKDTEYLNDELIIKYLSFCYKNKQWEEIVLNEKYIDKISSEDYKIYAQFTLTISIIMSNKQKDINIVIDALSRLLALAECDNENILENNLHIFIAYCYYLLDDKCLLENTIDKLPIAAKYTDLDDNPYLMGLELNFSDIYKKIFQELIKYAEYSKNLKSKISTIYTLYLYHQYEYYEKVRFNSKNLKDLITSKNLFDDYIEYYNIVCNMNIGIKKYTDAIKYYLECYDFTGAVEKLSLNLSDILSYIDEDSTEDWIKNIIEYIENNYLNKELCNYIITPFIEKLFDMKNYKIIYDVVKKIDIKDIEKYKEKIPLFCIAYSSKNYDTLFSRKIYDLELSINKNNHAAINNLGNIYEELGYITKASEMFNKALAYDNFEQIYINNCDRISNKIILLNKALENLENEELDNIDILLSIMTQRDKMNVIDISKLDMTKFKKLQKNDVKQIISKFTERNYLIKDKEKYVVNMSVLEYINKLSENIEKNREYKMVAEKINFKTITNYGYDGNLIKKLNYIKDKELRKILQRDLKECAIAYAGMQYKSAIILGGSIIEAILTYILKKNGITSYVFQKNGKNKPKKIENMGIDEMLHIVNEKRLISTTIYHLNHYVREYRNTIHPSSEIRNNYKVDEPTASMTWNILKETINSLE